MYFAFCDCISCNFLFRLVVARGVLEDDASDEEDDWNKKASSSVSSDESEFESSNYFCEL